MECNIVFLKNHTRSAGNARNAVPCGLLNATRWAFLFAVTAVALSRPATADTLQIRKPSSNGESLDQSRAVETVQGEVLIEAQDGSMLFQELDGRLRVLKAVEIASKDIQDQPLDPLGKEELGKSLLAQLPEGFKIYTTDDYVIAHQTERSYAKWIGNLYQGRLKRNFNRFWSKRQFKLSVKEPRFPLVAVIFANRQQYAAYVQRELGISAGAPVAYYNLETNRVTMFDLTADQQTGAKPIHSERDIDRILRDPRSIPMVTTIIHEGTHQLMFNSGLQTRLADTPLWLSEGVAMFFEPPDRKSKQGWNGPGRTNYIRLNDLKKNDRAGNALEQLISGDQRFKTDDVTTLAAYAESWALTHFLINRKAKAFGEYLKFLAAKQPQQPPLAGQRIADFKQFFGDDLQKLDQQFIQYVKRLN
jgi:hypothetical protein